MYRNQNFGNALMALKDGLVASRRGWNGRGMFVYYVPPASYKAQTGVAKKFYGEEAMVPYAGYFALKNADGQVHVWVPSTGDLLAEDWTLARVGEIDTLMHEGEVC